MERLKRAAIYLLACAVLITCKKEHLPPATTAGQPVFMFNGTINSSSVSLLAGVNNYYMYSSYTQDANNVYNFMGTLKSTQTNNNSLQFIINDYKVSAANASTNIDTSLTGAYYSFNKPGGNITSYNVAFTPILDGGTPIAPYTWTFGDGTVLNADTNVNHVYKHPGNYSTSLSVQFASGCTTGLANIVSMGTRAANFKTAFGIMDSLGSPYTLAFTAYFTGGRAINYSWNFGDGHSQTSTTNSVYHHYADSGQYTVGVTVTDTSGLTNTFNENIVTSGYTTQCVANYAPVATPIANPISLSNVTIEYTDGAGNLYTSNSTLQPVSSYFQIISVSPYQNNDNNQTTKMLNVQFNCLLYPTSGSPIPASGTAVIAVAYK